MRWPLWIIPIFLTACVNTSSPIITTTASLPALTESATVLPTENPNVAGTGTRPNIEIYRKGDPVTFHLDDTIYFCAGQSTYSIVQLIEGGTRELGLNHSCLGFVGTGVDQYCQDGQVKTVYVGECSDAIVCEERLIHGAITWNQKEYIIITENCAGQVIRREVEQQVPAGAYQIILKVIQNEKIVRKVVKEFLIVP
jgi:hypothetical protein